MGQKVEGWKTVGTKKTQREKIKEQVENKKGEKIRGVRKEKKWGKKQEMVKGNRRSKRKEGKVKRGKEQLTTTISPAFQDVYCFNDTFESNRKTDM